MKKNMLFAAIVLLAMLSTATATWADTGNVADGVYYLDGDGVLKNTATDGIDGNDTPTVLTGSETSLAAGWFVVNHDITFTSTITYDGDIHIILVDGFTMNVGTSVSKLTSTGIEPNNFTGTVTIYGQTGNTGTLSIYTTKNSTSRGIQAETITINSGHVIINTDNLASDALYAPYENGGITINGGIIEANASHSTSNAIYAYGSITINGGQVTAIGGKYGIFGWQYGNGYNINLGWRNAADFICVSSYGLNNSTVNIADGQVLKDDSGNFYSGTLNDDQKQAIAGKTLRPVISDFQVNEAGTEYTINTAAGWGYFCDYVESGESFSGKTVKLGDDITITRMASSTDPCFRGTFDGQGHTLTLNYGTANDPIDAQFIAPFVMTYWNTSPTFRNLTIDGHIYEAYTGSEAHNVGGLIGHLYGDVTIEHCTSNVEITSTGGAGGFVGLCEHTVNFTDCLSSAVVHSADGNNSGFVSWSRASGYAINFTGCLFNGKLLQQNGSGHSNGGFIGWTGSNKTVTITNCLYAPAALAEGEAYASDNSATFARGWNESTTATNCYYTTDFNDGTHNTGQGKQRRSITAGENVTVAYAGTATVYATSGITSYGTGIKYDNVLYAGSDDAVSLTLGNTPPTGYGFSGYTASAGTLTGTANPYTLTMPDADVTIGATFDPLPVSVKYIDANGVEQTVTALPLAGGATTHLSAGWYVVNSNITYTGTVYLDGNVNLILVDDAVMNVTNARFGIMGNDKGISFSVYGQGGQSGELNVSNSSYAIFGQGDILIAGGNVTVVGCKFGIHAENGGNVTIKNATVTASMANDENDGKCISSYGGVVTIDNSNVTAIGKGNLGIGIYTENGNIVIRNGGKTTAKAAYPSTIYAGNGDITITDCEVEVTGACGLFAENWNKDGVDITIQNAKVTASDSYYAIYSKNGDVTIEGGQVSATGAVKGIMVEGSGNIVLGWTNATDYIYANSYSVASGTVSIAGSKVMSNGTEELTGTISDLSKVNGKTLRPYNPVITLASATIFGESKYVGTFFSSAQDFQLPEGARAYTASLDGTKVVFHQIGDDGRVIPHGTAAIVVADAANITLTTTSTTVSAYAGNILQGSDTALAKPAGTVYVLGVDNGGVPGFYTFTGSTIPAGKAYYVVD